MFAAIRKFFAKEPVKVIKKMAIMDGDQDLPKLMRAYHSYIANTGTETHFVKCHTVGHLPPKAVRDHDEINQIYLSGFTGKKEVTDKYIGAMIQQAITDGYNHITVISADYDFIDIFKMAVMINPAAAEITFRMIAPGAQGRVAQLPDHIANIEIVKTK